MAAGLEVADIFRRHGERYRQTHDAHLGRVERRVMSAVEMCRTARLGGHVQQCQDCAAFRIAYNSCRNRHCPKCQGQASRDWLAARQADLLPVGYFHVVFTLPQQIAAIAFQNKNAVYTILFRAVAETLRKLAADPRHLGAEIGFIAVLHSWGQNLHYHPHIHCIVPGGGLSFDQSRWVACRQSFFLPVRVLSRLFRRLFLNELKQAYDLGQLQFFGDIAGLADPLAFNRTIKAARRIDWVVYAKPPFAGPKQVLAYLGRYTHRI
ncbi:transposase, partial [Rhizobium ruizarguesonis]